MTTPRAWLGPVLSLVVAVVAGIAIAYVDSRPGWDSTGITAGLLAVAALIAVLIEGSGRAVRVAAIAVLVGIWIPIFEVAAPGTSGTLLAFVFSAVGAFVGWVIVRGVAKPPTEDGPA
ncbi:MAG: hypothetical protein QOI92_2634 [Chloroflexota bacterium]|jgi:hypothetical protein|nr:hypothetical protein [Chloroflexota bacterium]